MANPRKELSYEERATWGACPVCKAAHGEACNPDVGIPLGMNINGQRPTEGAHLGRLQRAPSFVELVPTSAPPVSISDIESGAK